MNEEENGRADREDQSGSEEEKEQTGEPELIYEASAKEAANLLRISESTVWRWADQGILPAYRVGRKKIRFRRSDLRSLIQPAKKKPAREKRDEMAEIKRLNLMAMSEAGAGGKNPVSRAQALQDAILARRGGERMADSWQDIGEAREERSADL